MSATFLSAFTDGKFNELMVFLLVFVLTYAILERAKAFGNNKNLSAIIAVAVGFITLTNPNIFKLILYLIPWFFILILVVFFILLGLMSLGLEYDSVKNAMNTWGPFHGTFLGFVGFVILVVLAQVYGSQFRAITSGSAGQASTASHVLQTASHVLHILVQPQMLALIFVFLVASLSVYFLTSSPILENK